MFLKYKERPKGEGKKKRKERKRKEKGKKKGLMNANANKNKNKRRKIKGNGTFGCVFLRSYACKKNFLFGKNKRYYENKISKLVSKNDNRIQNEIQICNTVQSKIPHFEKFYAPILESCPVSLFDLNIDPTDFSKCHLFSQQQQQQQKPFSKQFYKKNYISLTMTNVGKKNFSDKMNYYLRRERTNTFQFILDSHLHLLEAITLLLFANSFSSSTTTTTSSSSSAFSFFAFGNNNNNDATATTATANADVSAAATKEFRLQDLQAGNFATITHLDLTPQNILIEKSTNLPIIIDFGLAFSYQIGQEFDLHKMKEMFYVYYTKHAPWPFEVVIINYILHIMLAKKGKLHESNTNIHLFLKNSVINQHDIQRLRTLIAHFIENNTLFQYSSNVYKIDTSEEQFKAFISKFKTQWLAFFTGFMDKSLSWIDLINHLMLESWSWDNYGLASLFIQASGTGNLTNNRKIKKYRKILIDILFYAPSPPTTSSSSGGGEQQQQQQQQEEKKRSRSFETMKEIQELMAA